jgi:hypothetical protein
MGDRKDAAAEVGIAATLFPAPEYQALLNQIGSGS